MRTGFTMLDHDETTQGSASADLDASIQTLVDTLLEGDRRTASQIFTRHLEDTGSFLATIDGLVQPAMSHVGACWERGEVSVAEEHLATATMKSVIASEIVNLSIVTDQGKSILLACVEGNHHELGLNVLGDAFELYGWETRTLGADVPTRALVDMVDRWRPDIVGLSLSLDGHLATAKDAVSAIRALGEPQPEILIGGSLPDNDGIASLDADGWGGSIQEAIEAVQA